MKTHLLLAPVLPSAAFPDGLPGLLVIEDPERVGIAYMLSPLPGYAGRWLLTKKNGKVYHLDLAEGLCSCPDARYRHRDCKHLRATKEVLAAVIDPAASLPPVHVHVPDPDEAPF